VKSVPKNGTTGKITCHIKTINSIQQIKIYDNFNFGLESWPVLYMFGSNRCNAINGSILGTILHNRAHKYE
jgi:hypothetical protein